MKTLRPNDFFLNEDAPASVEHVNGMMSVKLQNNGDCFVNAVIIPPSDWAGDSVRVKVRLRSANNAGDHVKLNVKLFSWPSTNDPTGPVGAVNNQVDVPLFSVNPAVLVSDQVLAEVPAGYSPDMALTLTISADIAASTEGIEARIVALEYEFV